MKKSYFVDGAMALALACTLVGCSKDDLSSGEVSTNSSIDAASDQNWQMLNTGKVNIGINKDAGESYSVKLYANDPFVNNEGTVLAEGTVTSGNTFTSTFTYPTADTTFYAAYKDSKGYTYVKAVRVDNNAITTSFGTESSANAKSNISRATSSSEMLPGVETPNFASYKTGTVELTNSNATVDWDGDANYTTKIKISSGKSWSGAIDILGKQGDHARTLYIEGTWNLGSAFQKLGSNGVIVVANGGEIVIPSGATLQGYGEARIYVAPGGKISGNGNLTFANGTNYSYNAGDISVTTINNNGGQFYNYGTMTSANLEGSSTGSIFENHGKMFIENCGNNAYNSEIRNACWLECTNMKAVNLYLGPNSYTHGENLEMGNGTANISSNAILDMTGNISLNNTTISGPTSEDFALIQFGTISYCNSSLVKNNVHISVEEGKTDTPYTPYWYFTSGFNHYSWSTDVIGTGNADIIQKGQAQVVIPGGEYSDGNCSVGYNYNSKKNEADYTPATEIEENKQTYTYAFEDTQNNTDYDLNDVVITIKDNEQNSNKLDISLVALGGTKFVKMYLGGNVLFNDKELHSVFGVSQDVMVNTGAEGGVTKSAVTTTIDKPSNFDFSNPGLVLYASTTGNISLATQGQDPHAIAVPGIWAWPLEKIIITKAYANFETFAKDGSHQTAKDWYNYPTTGKVYTE